MNKKVKSSLILTLTALIWGTAFVAQREGMSSIGPFLFSAIRMGLGVLTILPVLYISLRLEKRGTGSDGPSPGRPAGPLPGGKSLRKITLQGGFRCGIIIFFASNFQQVGLVSVSAGKAAFITTLYILLVPLMGLFLKHKLNRNIWTGVLLGTAGLYLLCITEAFSIAPGDLIVLIGAFFWALHILCIDYYTRFVLPARLVILQFLTAGILSLAVSFFTEPWVPPAVAEALPSLLYAGILSSGLAFTFQAIGQKDAHPTTASIIMSTEALFGAVAGYIFLSETFTSREFWGCVLMFGAVIIAQLPAGGKKKEESL